MGTSRASLLHGFIVHHVPGRMRLKFSEAGGCRADLSQIAQACAKIEGVQKVEVNPVTGTILLLYRRDLSGNFPVLLDGIPANGSLFTLDSKQIAGSHLNSGETRKPSQIAASIVNAVRNLNTEVKQATNNTVDLAVILPLVAAVLAFRRRGSEQGTPVWMTLAIFSFQSFIVLHNLSQRQGRKTTAAGNPPSRIVDG